MTGTRTKRALCIAALLGAAACGTTTDPAAAPPSPTALSVADRSERALFAEAPPYAVEGEPLLDLSVGTYDRGDALSAYENALDSVAAFVRDRRLLAARPKTVSDFDDVRGLLSPLLQSRVDAAIELYVASPGATPPPREEGEQGLDIQGVFFIVNPSGTGVGGRAATRSRSTPSTTREAPSTTCASPIRRCTTSGIRSGERDSWSCST